ncbi:hypothetical protein [Spirillospora sp. NPDC048823]|uniref:hypothetical protein n=1 Tax=unclassified Spirillospora TaxID=2642701 RepID=UPI00371E37CB
MSFSEASEQRRQPSGIPPILGGPLRSTSSTPAPTSDDGAGLHPALLDPDTRLVAALRLFDSRRSTAMSLVRQAADLLVHVRKVIGRSGFPYLPE